VTYSTEEYSIRVLELCQRFVGQRVARSLYRLVTNKRFVEHEFVAEALADLFQNFLTAGGHFFSNAVAWENGYFILLTHRFYLAVGLMIDVQVSGLTVA
jgi:hypothetical protein